MNIRIMTIYDYEKVFNLWIGIEGMGLNSVDDSKDGILKYLSRNPSSCFVAERDEKIVGVIMSGHDGRRGFVYHLSVSEPERNHGVGSSLLSHALAALEKEGISKVALVVFSDNYLGNNFWSNNGFIKREDLFYRNKNIN